MALVKMLQTSRVRAYYSNKRPRGGRQKRHGNEKLLLGKPRTRNDDKRWAGLRGQSGDHVEREEDTEEGQAYLLPSIKGLAGRVANGGMGGVMTQF